MNRSMVFLSINLLINVFREECNTYKIPTEREVRGRLSARASIPGLTRVQAPQGRTRVNPRIDASADNRPSTSLEVGIRFIRSFNILTTPRINLFANYHLLKVGKTVSNRRVALLFQCLHERDQCRTIACRVVPSCNNSQL